MAHWGALCGFSVLYPLTLEMMSNKVCLLDQCPQFALGVLYVLYQSVGKKKTVPYLQFHNTFLALVFFSESVIFNSDRELSRNNRIWCKVKHHCSPCRSYSIHYTQQHCWINQRTCWHFPFFFQWIVVWENSSGYWIKGLSLKSTRVARKSTVSA